MAVSGEVLGVGGQEGGVSRSCQLWSICFLTESELKVSLIDTDCKTPIEGSSP